MMNAALTRRAVVGAVAGPHFGFVVLTFFPETKRRSLEALGSDL